VSLDVALGGVGDERQRALTQFSAAITADVARQIESLVAMGWPRDDAADVVTEEWAQLFRRAVLLGSRTRGDDR
jgi:hypothetical protein